MDVDEHIDTLKQEAREKTGLDDFGGDGFEEPLRLWMTDLASPSLNDMGRAFLRRLARRDLYRRLAIVDQLKRHPEIADVVLPPIVLITGYPRTGTTLLHNLMSLHPSARSLLRWELTNPVPPPEASTYATDPRIAKVQASMEPLRGSLLERMHWVNADDPEECAWGFYDCTGLLGNGCWAAMPTWGRYVMRGQLESTYAEYRQLVQLLLWKNPVPEGGVLVLKAPQTAGKIHTFANVFPEARMVFTHRDPFRSLISACTVGDAICAPFMRGEESVFEGDGDSEQRALDIAGIFYAPLTSFARQAPERVVNVHYDDLMRDAITATEGIYSELGIDTPAELAEGIGRFLARQREGRRARPPSSYDPRGYTKESVWADPVIGDYCDHFAVRVEGSRLTDTRSA